MTTPLETDELGLRTDAAGRACACGARHAVDPPVEPWVAPEQRSPEVIAEAKAPTVRAPRGLGTLDHSPESMLTAEERALPLWKQPNRRELVKRLRINGHNRKTR